MDLLRDKIRTCGKSRYVICKETGLDKAALCRIMQGGGCNVETVDILLEYFDLEVVKKKRKRKKG